MRTTIILARHGETQWNKERRAQGKSDIPLSEVGIKQAKALAKRLIALGITRIYSSKLKRASHTARIVAEALSLPFEEHQGFNERDLGVFEGKTWEEINKVFLGSGEELIITPIDDGEAHEVFLKRVTEALNYVVAKHKGEKILIVCHGGVLYALVKRLKKIPHNQHTAMRFRNTSISIFHIDGDNVIEETIADASHLEIVG